jgi:cell division protein FtsN
MDDIQVLLYIVIGLFYFIAKFMKKKPVPQKPVQKPATGSADTNAPQKPLTFEELLKEMKVEKMLSQPINLIILFLMPRRSEISNNHRD